MRKLSLFTLIFLTALFTLLTPGTAYGGGGPVAFWVSPNGPLSPGEQYVVNIQVTDGANYCKNCQIKLKFQNPQDNDYIAQSSNITDDQGRIYAKVISKINDYRTMYTEVTRVDGTTITPNKSTVTLNYTGESSLPNITPSSAEPTTTSQSANPFITSDSFPQVKITYQKYLGGVKREVGLQWNAIPNAIKYNVYLYDQNDAQLGGALAGTGSTNAVITVNSDTNFYVGIDACFQSGQCVSNFGSLWKLYLEKMYPQVTPYIKVTPVVLPAEEIVEPKITPDTRIDELNKKVSTLEDKLAESQRRQNALEQLINNLFSWIKSHSLFFR